MPYQIDPLKPEDLPALGHFLADGFGAPIGSEFAAADVLQWKYFDPRPGLEDRPRSFVARDEAGRIVGHVGFRHTTWRQAGSTREISTLHMLDWLGSREHRAVGVSLLRCSHRQAEIQYGLGGSGIARRVGSRAHYERLDPVPVFRRVLRPGYRLREGGPSPGRRALLAARDAARLLLDRPRRSAGSVALQPVAAFGPEVEAITARCPGPLLFTGRHADELNITLSYPRGGPTAWMVEARGEPIGFALLNIVPQGRLRIGKVVDLFLDTHDPGLWGAAFAALAGELKHRGADVALACGAPPWESEGLRAAGFRHAFDLDVYLRDPDRLLPRDAIRHLSFLEGDYAYIP